MIPNVRYYIRKNNEAYFEVYPTKKSVASKELYSGEHFYRYGWSDSFEFRNYEKTRYRSASNQKLFDTLINYTSTRDFIRFKDTYKIKLDYNNEEIIIEGYFGVLDYQVNNNDNAKIITITPTIYDIYTNLLNNIDKKIDIFNGATANKLGNGDFEVWDDDNTPTGWTLTEDTRVFRYRYLGSNMAKLMSANPLAGWYYSDMSKSVSNVKSNSTVNINFSYILTKDTYNINYRSSRYVIITFLADDLSEYSLNQNGEWVEGSPINYYYANDLLLIDNNELSSVTKLYSASISANPIPKSGTLTILFNGGFSISSTVNTYTIIDNVIIRVNTTQTKTIKARIYDSYLQLIPKYIDSLPTLRSSPKKNDYDNIGGIGEYFNGNGEPTAYLLSNVTYAPNDSENGLYLSDWINIFNDQSSSQYTQNYYKCQLSEITVYECETYKKGIWPFQTTMQRIYASATFARDYATTVNDAPPQEESGWEKTGFLNDKGEYEWVRKPFNTESTEWILGEVEEEGLGTFNGFTVLKRLTSKRNYPTVSGEYVELKNCIELRDIIKNAFNQTHSEYADKDVVSQFIWNDFPNEYPTFNSTTNYVTGKVNVLKNIACQHTFELKQLGSTDPITEQDLKESALSLSLNDLLNNLKAYFKTNEIGHLYWFLTPEKNLRIEHISYFYISGTSISSQPEDGSYTPVSILQNYDQYKYALEQMPSRITFTQINSGYKDFVDNEMTFDTITSGTRDKELKLENNIEYFTTDLRYCIENKDNLDNGLILINYEFGGIDYFARYGLCRLQGSSFLNGELSLSSILNNYCRYEGVYISGYINKENVNFAETIYNKEGIEITIKGIVDESFIRTKMGTGKVISFKFDFDKLTTTVLLRYSSRTYIDAGVGKVLDLGFYI